MLLTGYNIMVVHMGIFINTATGIVNCFGVFSIAVLRLFLSRLQTVVVLYSRKTKIDVWYNSSHKKFKILELSLPV